MSGEETKSTDTDNLTEDNELKDHMVKRNTKMPETTKPTNAAEWEYGTKAPKATKTTEGPRNAHTRRETGNTAEDEKRPWQCIM